jgi:hypothetical protein
MNTTKLSAFVPLLLLIVSACPTPAAAEVHYSAYHDYRIVEVAG